MSKFNYNTATYAYFPPISLDPRFNYPTWLDSPFSSSSDKYTKSVMPYNGKLIGAYMNINVGAVAEENTEISFCVDGGTAGKLTASFGSTTQADNCVLSYSIDASFEAGLSFSAGDIAALGWCAPSGNFDGGNVSLIYEFDIT
jgi:hypothetical protein